MCGIVFIPHILKTVNFYQETGIILSCFLMAISPKSKERIDKMAKRVHEEEEVPQYVVINDDDLLKVKRRFLKDFDFNARYTPFKDVCVFSDEKEIVVHLAVNSEGYEALITVNDGSELTSQKKATSKPERMETWINNSIHELVA